MRGVFAPSTVVLLLMLVAVAGFCVTSADLPVPHSESTEGCCALAQCPILAASLLSLTFVVIAMTFMPTPTLAVRSSVQPPIAPPPELTVPAGA